jgi:TolB-like protein/Flp pilus assembly protein TadD
VLDFGIARDTQPGADTEPEATLPGSILGTVSYMSPEQARGKGVDAATDLWAFGCVLYRILCGRNAFPGDTRWDRLAAVLREEPDLKALPVDTPQAIRDLIERCLVKDRSKRMDDAGAARRIVESVLGISTISAEGVGVADMIVEDRTRGSAVRWLLFVALAVLAVWLGARAVSRMTETGSAGLAATRADRSIAVLPFENVGDVAENAAFTAGIHDDILNRVAKIGDLRVISRTSVLEYRDTVKSLQEIGADLDVAHVLEGGVQRSGDEVHINLRLIEVASEELLWSESFDRKLSAEQLFSIQSDVAGEVAVALQATLSADERGRIDLVPTDNLEAYDAYLKGLEYYHRMGQLEEDFIPARRMFKRATELDPTFALAYAALSRAAGDHHWFGSGGPDALYEARRAAERAVEIAPDLSEAHMALGTYFYMKRDYDAALEQLSIAEQGLPGDSELIRWKAFIMRRRGMWDQALNDLKRVLALDPRDADTAMEVGFTLLNQRRYEEADRFFADSLDLAPDYPAATVFRSLLPLLRDGSAASAVEAADGIESVAGVEWRYAHGWQAMLSVGDYERAARMATAIDRVTGQWHDYPQSLLLGWTYRLEGREAEAAEQFSAAVKILEDDASARPEDARLHTSLGIAYAGLGRFDEAIRSGRRGVELMPIARDTFTGTWLMQDLGWIYVMAGELDLAIDAFNRILEIPSMWSIELLLADPRTNPLRDHEGFRALVDDHEAGNSDRG